MISLDLSAYIIPMITRAFFSCNTKFQYSITYNGVLGFLSACKTFHFGGRFRYSVASVIRGNQTKFKVSFQSARASAVTLYPDFMPPAFLTLRSVMILSGSFTKLFVEITEIFSVRSIACRSS